MNAAFLLGEFAHFECLELDGIAKVPFDCDELTLCITGNALAVAAKLWVVAGK
jgi:hypothetical protein